MTRSTLLTTHKVPITNFNALASQLRQAGAKFRSSIQKQEATIVFSELPSKALSILEYSANLQVDREADFNVETPTESSVFTPTQASCTKQETFEFPSNMEFPENQEVIYQNELAIAETQLTEVNQTTVLVELSEESSMDDLVETTTQETVECLETTAKPMASTRSTATDDLEFVGNAIELVESNREISMDDPVEAFDLATEQQLLELSKTKLKKLANKYGIEGRTKMEHHEIAAALANRVPVNNL